MSIDQELTAMWSELLGAVPVDHDTSFLALGGDSIFVVHLASYLEDRFGIVLPLMTIFEAPTIRLLAVEVERRLPGPQSG